jgi:hypothetical protein
MAALIGFAVTLKSFGDSFRVGIDEKKPDKLVTSGMFAISRNPIYVCFCVARRLFARARLRDLPAQKRLSASRLPQPTTFSPRYVVSRSTAF